MNKPHGHFEITRRNKIIILTFFDSWNIEAVKDFFKAYKESIEKWNLDKFGVLSDLTEFTGGTPDAMVYFHQITQWAISKGQIARVVIADTEYKKFTLKTIDQDKVQMPTHICKNMDEALVWLKQFDLQ